MYQSDPETLAARLWTEARAGLSLLSRLPLPAPTRFPNPPAVWAWPVAGLVLGGLASLGAALGGWFGLPASLAAALFLGLGTLMTGALHEDGLADSCDGLWGGWTRERRLEIMKDSHIGSYGVMGLVLVTLARWSAVTALISTGAWGAMIAAAILSRAPMVALISFLPNARGSGLSQSVGRPDATAALLAMLVAFVLALGVAGGQALIMALWVAAMTLALAVLAWRKIGGQTGDILGASQQLGELAALAAACTLL